MCIIDRMEGSHDPREAAVGGVADSGRVIFAAAAAMLIPTSLDRLLPDIRFRHA